MSSPQPAFEAEALKRVEYVYRKQLTEDPSDPVSRLSLAWCLFMQSLLRAGQESVLEALVEATDAGDAPLECAWDAAAEQDAAQLLDDCLTQTMTVKQLSADPATHYSAERLLTLVRLSGGSQALSAAESRTAGILGRVTREIFGTPRPTRGKPRRSPTRRPAP